MTLLAFMWGVLLTLLAVSAFRLLQNEHRKGFNNERSHNNGDPVGALLLFAWVAAAFLGSIVLLR